MAQNRRSGILLDNTPNDTGWNAESALNAHASNGPTRPTPINAPNARHLRNTQYVIRNTTLTFHVSRFLLVLIFIVSSISPAFAQSITPPPLTQETIYVLGAQLLPDPIHQTVPKNTATGIRMDVVASDPSVGGLPELPADAVVRASMRGPAFQQAIELTGLPGQLLMIPPIPLKGLYVVENIRVESRGATILQGEPGAVSIEVIDKVIVSQVTTRALSADEIEEKGIFFDEENFSAVDFTVAIGVEGKKVPISFPVLIPKVKDLSPRAPTYRPPPGGLGQQKIATAVFRPPQLEYTSLGISGFQMDCASDCNPETRRLVAKVPGVILFPGRIAYLNQFFSALLLVSNIAPGTSNLVVRDIQGEILLPGGRDGVVGSQDDPLRMARIGNPPQSQPKILSVKQPGPDGELGTADDIPFLAPGNDGNAEFLVEGLREGIHTVQIEITGQLYGLPTGPVAIKGKAVGTLEVRDPQFTLTFNHPLTINQGEDYDFHVTVTNISDVPANFATLSLLPRSLSGAQLLSGETVQIDTILPGDSSTATFRLRALQTGSVVASSLASENTPGKFEFRMDVGELGIPLSPNVLQLPNEVNFVPAGIRAEAISLLSQAFALATSPITPIGLLPVDQSMIYERAFDLAAVGQRISLFEPELSAAWDLALDFSGNNLSRLTGNERITADDFAAFDELLRKSRRGEALSREFAAVFGQAVVGSSALNFQQRMATATLSRPPYFSVITGQDAGGGPVVLRVTAPDGKQMGKSAANAPIQRSIPYGQFFDLSGETGNYSHFAFIAAPQPGRHTVDLTGVAAGTFDVGVLIPTASGQRLVQFEDVTIQAGGRAQLSVPVFDVGRNRSSHEIVLNVDASGDGFFEGQLTPTSDNLLPEAGPDIISAVQVASRDRFGRLVAVLFDEEISPSAAQQGKQAGEITNFSVDENQILATSLQPSSRVAFLRLRDGIGPFIPRSVTVANIDDRHTNLMSPLTVTLPISITVTGTGGEVDGQVVQADGTPVPNAAIQLIQKILAGDKFQWVTITSKAADADGRFHLDYVTADPTRFVAANPGTGERVNVGTTVRYNGQRLDLRLIFSGKGTVAGRIYAADGTTPLPGAQVGLTSLTSGQTQVATSDASGGYVFGNVPVGNANLIAVHKPTRAQAQAVANVAADGGTTLVDLTLINVDRVQRERGSVSGRVYRSDGVTAAEGVPVYSTLGGYTITDSSGYYQLTGLPPGKVTVSAFDQSQFETAEAATTIVAGQDVTANLILFGGTGTIEGTVLDGAGLPVADATIGGGLQLVKSDADGRFVIPDMPLGKRTIQALVTEGELLAQATVNLLRPGETASVILRLPVVGRIAGRVTQADGTTPVPNLEILAIGPRLLGSRTDANGFYLIPFAVEGNYILSAFKPDFKDGNARSVRVSAHNQTVNGDIRWQGKGRLHVTILDDDSITPLAAQVGLSELQVVKNVIKDDGNPSCYQDVKIGDTVVHFTPCQTVGIGYTTKQLNRIVDNDPSSGSYLFEDVFVGPVSIAAVNAFNGKVATNTTVKLGETTYITLSLKATSSLSGTVYLPDGVTPVGEGIVVRFNSRTMQDVPVATDASGVYTVPLITAGGFNVTALDEVSGLTGRSAGGVGVGGHAVVDIRLLGLGSVAVKVVGTTGAAIPNAPLHLRESNFTKQSRTGQTDSNGNFTFPVVREGRFSVYANNPANGGKGFRGGTLPAPGETVTVTVTVPDEFGAVTGRFFRADGTTPISDAQIHLTSSFDGRDIYEVTDASGIYTFTGVPKAGFSLDAFDFITGREGRGSGAITANGQTVTVNIGERPQGEVRGYVVESLTGAAMPGATVSLSSNDNGKLYTSAGPDGGFVFPGVNAGNFRVSASDKPTGWSGSASGSLASEGQIVTTTVALQVPERGTVEGIVTEANGSPSTTAQVQVSYGRTVRSTTVDGSGFYRVENVPVGGFSVTALAQVGGDGGRGSGTISYHTEVVTVPVQLLGTGTITGVVVDGSGNPVASAEVKVRRKSSVPRSFAVSLLSGIDGTFRVDNALLGDFSVSARNPANGLGGSADGVLAASGGSASVTVVLQAAGSIAGRVLREDGTTPAPDMTITVRKSGSTRYGVSDGDGRFTFEDLPLGSYTISVEDPLGSGTASGSATVASQGQTADAGDLRLDESYPSVVSITPASGSSGQPVTRTIEIVFSEPVDSATVNAANVEVSAGGALVSGSRALNGAGDRLTFTPSTAYPDFATVNVKVKSGVKDLSGKNLSAEFAGSFTTQDTTPPSITTFSPADNAQNVALESVLRVQYSEALNPAAYSAPAVQLFKSGTAVAGRIDFIQNNSVIVFTPNAPLLPNAVYTATILPATDRAGNRQPAGRTLSFTSLDIIPPAIESLTSNRSPSVIVGDSLIATAQIAAGHDDIRQVDFYVNGVLRRSDTQAPYELLLQVESAMAPALTIGARAIDNAGNVSPDKGVVLNVLSDTPPVATLFAPLATTVEVGYPFSVTVGAVDDLAVNRLFAQATGGVTTTFAATIDPASPTVSRTFVVNVPANARLGSAIALQASAADGKNQVSNFAQMTVVITGTQLAFTGPADGTVVTPGETVTVSAQATDVDGIGLISLAASGAASFADQRTVAPAQTNAAASFALPIPANAPSNGIVTLSLRGQDSKGNLSIPITRTLRIRDIVPPSVTLTAAGNATSLIQGTSLAVTVAAGDDVNLAHIGFRAAGVFNDGVVTGVTPVTTNANRTFTITAEMNATPGQLLVTGVATDTSANVGSSSPLTLTVLADAPPGVVFTGPAEGAKFGPGQRVTVTVALTDDLSLSSVGLVVTGAVSHTSSFSLSGTSATRSFGFDIPGSAVGSLQATVTVTDSRGYATSAVRNLTVGDVTPPALSFIGPADNSLHNPGASADVRVLATDNDAIASVAFTTTGVISGVTSFAVDPASASAPVTISLTIPLTATGNQSVLVRAVAFDREGNPSPSASLTLRVRDILSPTVSVSLPLTQVVQGDGVTVTLNVSDEVGVASVGYASVGVASTGSATVSPALMTASRTLTFTVPASVDAGTVVTVTGTATDTSANLGVSSPVTFTVISDDPPAGSFTSPPQGSRVGRGADVQVRLAITDDLSLAGVTLDASPAVTPSQSIDVNGRTASPLFTVSVPASAALDSTLLLTATVRDSRGQSSGLITRTLLISDVIAPVVSITSPTNGVLVDPGAEVAIVVEGSDNEGVAALLLSTSGVVVSADSTGVDPASASAQRTFRVTIPANATGNQSLTVQAQAVDIAGQASPFASISLPVRDVFSPAATLTVSPPDNRVVQGVALDLTVGGADEVKVTAVGYRSEGAVLSTGTTVINPPATSASRGFSLTVPASLDVGAVLTVTAVVTDSSGNVGRGVPFTATVVAPGGPLTGTVRFSGGAVIPNAALSVVASNGSFTATSDATGVYTVPFLLPGSVAVDAVDPASGFRGRSTGSFGAYALSLRLDVVLSGDPLVNITFPTDGYPLVHGET
ncbi:MAG: carboxypeptidase regulatory-like domain-containing protein, partial [Caldilineaceae bacterium]